MEVKNKNQISIETSMGELKAVVQHDKDFPGVLLYLGEELYARFEFYEDTKELRLIAYNDTDEEPTIIETLKSFN